MHLTKISTFTPHTETQGKLFGASVVIKDRIDNFFVDNFKNQIHFKMKELIIIMLSYNIQILYYS